MRFKCSQYNLTIQLSEAETGDCVRRILALLVPRFTRKVYLNAIPSALFQGAHAGLVVVTEGQ